METEALKQDRLRGQVLNLCHVDHGLTQWEMDFIDDIFKWEGYYREGQEKRSMNFMLNTVKDIVIKRPDGLYVYEKHQECYGFTNLMNATHYSSRRSAKKIVDQLRRMYKGLILIDFNNPDNRRS